VGVNRTALVQVLGAVSYGEWKAYENAKERAAQARAAGDEDEAREWRRTAAEELRHHKGFVARLDALGADPDRAMRPYRHALDTYHGRPPASTLEEAVWGFLGEGVADDLLRWLRRVADPETAAFVDTVLADEERHEARAAAELRARLDDTGSRAAAGRAARRMFVGMIGSGRSNPLPFAAFLRLGRPHELLGAVIGGQRRRLTSIGLRPLGLPARV
jgi:DNA-binding ferritin-like protein (Dps family)